jgi:hypothetical protein
LSSFSSFPEYEDCKIVVIPAKYDTKPYAYGFQKDSPYLGVFNYYIKEMREKGTLKQIQKKYDPPDQVLERYQRSLNLPRFYQISQSKKCVRKS